MKTVLLFGDSNTHGANPSGGARFGLHERWGGVCRDALGDAYYVIEEGLGGRTTVWDDPIEAGTGSRNGLAYLLPCLYSHQPLDVVAILLGTNDLKKRFSLNPIDVANGAGRLVSAVLNSTAGVDGRPPKCLLVCPPPFKPLAPIARQDLAEMFEGGEAKSKLLAPRYQAVAETLGAAFLNAGDVIESSPVDGIHWELDAHRALGLAVAEKLRGMV